MEDIQPISDRHDFKWYAVRTFTSHETRVKTSIEQELERLSLVEKIRSIIIPQETVYEVRNGKRRTRIKNTLPGYLLIEANLDKRLKEIICSLPSVVSFAGTKTAPTPIQQDEVDRIMGRIEERKNIASLETAFSIGDPVKVIDGPFNTFNGSVKAVNIEKQKLKVEVGILGRKTPVELDFSQVEIENH